jgi:hypothetical protein
LQPDAGKVTPDNERYFTQRLAENFCYFSRNYETLRFDKKKNVISCKKNGKEYFDGRSNK